MFPDRRTRGLCRHTNSARATVGDGQQQVDNKAIVVTAHRTPRRMCMISPLPQLTDSRCGLHSQERPEITTRQFLSGPLVQKNSRRPCSLSAAASRCALTLSRSPAAPIETRKVNRWQIVTSPRASPLVPQPPPSIPLPFKRGQPWDIAGPRRTKFPSRFTEIQLFPVPGPRYTGFHLGPDSGIKRRLGA